MEESRFHIQWPDGVSAECYIHEIMHYRYHWHRTDYEFNILLRGSQEFCRGNQTFFLEPDDLLLVPPGVGHASLAHQPGTQALVVHFSASALKPYVEKGCTMDFPCCLSSCETRSRDEFKLIRFCAAQVYDALAQKRPYARLSAKAGIEMLLSVLCTRFSPTVMNNITAENVEQQELLAQILAYMEQHYAEKLTLQDLAEFAQYNRTYISTLFKSLAGLNFHEHLTRIRFQHALIDLFAPDINLTNIALENGFSDLKSFSALFKETFGLSPAKYRAMLSPKWEKYANAQNFTRESSEFVREKINEYLCFSPC